jgi:hypothetical protein
VTLNDLVRKAKVATYLPDLVFVEIFQRFNDSAKCPELSHEVSVVVVRLDSVSFATGQS